MKTKIRLKPELSKGAPIVDCSKGFHGAVLGLVLALSYSTGQAQTTVNYAMSSMGLANGTAVGTTVRNTTDSNITFTFAQNSSGTAPAYYDADTAVRLYQNATKGGSIIIMVASGYKLTAFTVTTASGSGDGPSAYLIDGGTEAGTWADGITSHAVTSINATSHVEFYNKGSSSTTRSYVQSFSVTYEAAAAAPTVSSSAATSVGATIATLNGNVASDGGATITERGFVYKTSSGVTITDNKTIVSGTTGSYSLNLSSLVPNQQYFFKAYAINSAGTTLSSPELDFTTQASVDTPTTTTISYDSGFSTPTTYGDAVGLKATVSPNPGAGITVTFKNGATSLGTGATDSSGEATYTTTASQLAAGTYSSLTATFAGGNGYAASLSSALSPAHVVDPKALSIGAPSIADKTYDGTATAGAVTVGALTGFVGSETVTATATAANYASANAATYPGNVVTYTLHDGTGGGLAANYSLAAGSASGTINAKGLTITASGVTKTAGTTLTGGAGSSAYSITSGSFVGSEGAGVTVTIAYGTGAAAGDPVGTYAGQVTPSAATGGTFDAGNYDISYAAGDIIVVPPLLAGWDFQTTGGGGTAAAAAPDAPLVYTGNFGSGTLYLDGSFGSSAWTSTTPNPQVTSFSGTAVNTEETSFSTTTASPACLAIANSSANGQSLVFKFSMTHRAGLIVSYATQGTSTGFDSHLWEYSTDGTTWTTAETVGSIPSSFATKTLATITSLNGAAAAYLRLTVSGATSASGNNRLDNIQIRASLVNTAPVANNDVAAAVHGQTISIPLFKLLANDTDADGDTLSITSVSGATLNGANVDYTAPGSGATASFTYTVADGYGGTDEGTVNITLRAANVGSTITALDTVTEPGHVILTASGKPSTIYKVQASDNGGSSWSQIGTGSSAANGVFNFTDTTPNYPSRLYRLAE